MPNTPKRGRKVEITDKELKELWFWANYGVGSATTGSYKTILKTLQRLRKQHKLSGLGKLLSFGQYVIK